MANRLIIVDSIVVVSSPFPTSSENKD